MKKNMLLLAVFVFVSSISFAQKTQEAIKKIVDQTNASVTKNLNGTPEFIKFPATSPLSLQGQTIQDKVVSFLEANKELFQFEIIESTFKLGLAEVDNYGLKKLTITQHKNNVPVFDAQLRFHFNVNDDLTAINGNYIPNIKIHTTPTISSEEANNKALSIVNNQGLNNSGMDLFAFKTTLYVFQKGLVQNKLGADYLAYEIEVRNNNDVREFLFIDAHNGTLVEQFTGIHAIDRVVYENDTSNVVWEEGDAFPGTLSIWQQNEVVASAHVYNFFNNAFGYVSYDGADAQMRTINNNPNISCPNANWNGVTANYCNGTASDDVIAHEWGHAYTGYTSGLIYAYQSGAINESYSDIWGETIDLLNNYEDVDDDHSLRTACDSSDRWRMGEDATAFGGAIRDLWNPPCNGDPGKVTDGNFSCGTFDSGGVHINSGIPNHAYALLVDGGTFNGQTINGIGFTKAAHIFWRTQSQYLTPTSDFEVLAASLEASCTDLIGINLEGLSTEDAPAGPSGEIITMSDFDELVKVLLAVELRLEDNCGYEPILSATADPCDAAINNPIFFEDWESGIGIWTVSQIPTNPGTWEPRDWEIDANLPEGLNGQAIFGVDPVNGNCSTSLQNGILRLESPVINIPDQQTGTFEMTFMHYLSTETNWDGGNLKYSIDGSSFELLPDSAFTANGYNGDLNTGANDNPMAGEPVFTGSDGGSSSGSWGRSYIDLSSIGVTANSTVQFRWELGTDGCNGREGWYVDDISVYNCDMILSVTDFEGLQNDIKVYPNPSNGEFTLRNLNNIELVKAEIFDINGRLIKTIDLSNGQNLQTIDITQVTTGIYFMNVHAKHASQVIKLIKQ